jgi:hypothetical protein
MNNAYNYFVKKLPKLFLVAKNTFGKNTRIKRISSQVERTWVEMVEKGNKHIAQFIESMFENIY